ncbi:MAG: hypothetical protein JST26_15565 [Bacteroidetes bacterium]|nr:hypothetical protein [Bacteroidota bacterium]
MIQELLNDKHIKPKEKTETISRMLLDGTITASELMELAKTLKDPGKATCIEALEFASQSKPELVDIKTFDFVSACLTEKAPRIKWESAKVIGNTARLHPRKLDTAIKNLLVNSEHSGTVVRWSAAFALGEILKLNLPGHKDLKEAAETICEREEKNSIKKIYLAAFKKMKA